MTTDVERYIGRDAGPPPPVDGLKATVILRGSDGKSCETAKYLILALRKMDASVWISHRRGGSLQLTDRGRDTRGKQRLWARFHQGQELTFTATGPEAAAAIDACKAMAEGHPLWRGAIYRERYRKRRRTRKPNTSEGSMTSSDTARPAKGA